MKQWLTQFRISSALDDRKPIPDSSKREMSPETRRFAENAERLDQLLPDAREGAEVPASLHASIMRSVRRSAANDQRAQPRFSRLVSAGAAFALILVIATIAQLYRGKNVSTAPSPSALMAASSALDAGGDWLRQAPEIALVPLSEEMQRLNRDIANAEDFLLASLP